MAESTKKDKGAGRGFLKGVKAEFVKIAWPDRETVGKQLLVVTVASVILGAIIATLDFFLQMGVDFLVSL